MAGHRCGDDEGAGSPLFEVCADGLCAVECAVEIGLDYFVPGLDSAVEDAAVGGAPGVCDEGVDFAEFFDYVCDETGYGLPVADVTLVGFDFDAVFFGEFFGVLLAAFGTGCAVGGGVLVCVVGR